MIQDIDKHISIINDSIKWATEYRKESFPMELFKDYRRKLNKIKRALSGNCSAAAYGESQVGKSYLMSSLLSSATSPFVIENEGKEYSFIDELNPSGGNNAKIESTGVITRFTINHGKSAIGNLIKVLNLSVVDIILLITDSYYNDIKINPDTVLAYDAINRELDNMSDIWKGASIQQSVITEDDIKDINDYVKDVIGNSAAAVYQSNFCKIVAPIIQYIPYDKWVDIFSLLWNQNSELDRLFATLINAYKKIDFQQEVYVPFSAVLREKGTLLKIEWLDTVCGVHLDTGNDEIYTDIFDAEGHLLAANFGKGELSALIAELTFELPESIANDRKFLQKMDLLDFPGARSREKYKEKEISAVLPKMLRRGKVAYLFNKYSRSLQISSVLFCHHNDQKAEPTIGETINSWIEENIGSTPSERSAMLRYTNGIAPLFFVATKFNIDLERTKTDGPHNLDTLDKHWDRFDTVFPEIIKPNKWLDEFVSNKDGVLLPFQNIYPLRDFYWSGKGNLFDGYSDGAVKSEEKTVHVYEDFPDYMDRLKDSFLRQPFVRKHFANPNETWNSVASLNNDGSKAIIRNLDSISTVLDDARQRKYQKQLDILKRDIINALQVFYEPEDIEAKNKKVRLIAKDIRRALMDTIANNPSAFGQMIDKFMINPEALRNIAYDVIICHTDTPKDFNAINFYKASAGIDINDTYEANINRLMTYCLADSEDELREYFQSKGFELEDIVSKESQTLSTIGDVVTKHIIDYWINYLNNRAQELSEILPHADEVVFMLVNLFNKLNIRRLISDKISRYTDIFSESEQPNAIGDYTSLTLNNFVSSVGRNYMSDNEITTIRAKAENCNLPVDLSPVSWERTRKPQSLLKTLQVFDESSSIVNQGRIDINTLRQLPFWNNYQRWENLVIIGLIYSSDISHCDPICNEKVKALIDRANQLYVG
jgi:hypothetical protein